MRPLAAAVLANALTDLLKGRDSAEILSRIEGRPAAPPFCLACQWLDISPLATQEQALAWLDQLEASDLARVLESQFFPDRQITLGEALTQVCLHSQGHRAQCATRLRLLGGEPPSTDYIFWVKDRLLPAWV